MINIKIEISENGFLPKYMTEGSSGADLYASSDTTIEPFDVSLVPTGIRVQIPSGYEIQIRPRSGFSLKNKILILNTPGTIDSDYRGEIKVIMFNLNREKFYIKRGDRIAQMVVAKVEKANFVEDKIDETERGDGGFGHTG
ncbi:MAG: Deoxyuridine 5'-triphosphate nucleotidohydrolase [candidate division TA06 bacterium 32_111]|uniref:Deoxyuridine 5'-triphosphate nucleotidohydrolase n=2 Tax=Bacteria candidate phyla TaxID=1783234 RepID=A0A117M769_UNCT6|nr:MAG: Deoxyuridine 5'-triphosphate nucleotidohydrolase [candidate division TA06 bacterium 32_111]KUK88147.1 MAG: Deoxyuridine 5'-triphosphate nucleotidohydrolase [candidate division TA06 bacterium 34_109]HAF07077.1 dUTP diphosphatase [candidate division WOR-3 bacterium]HCP16992.1 dUTP diphosphatase [candidate division WOR-3 bacterium]